MMRWSRIVPVIYLLIACQSAFSQEALGSGKLVVLSDVPVVNMLASEAAWLGDERGLVIGGWEEWPSQPMIVVAPFGGRPVALNRPATPHFALSPTREEIAYWVASGGGWSQLGVVPLAGAPIRYLGDARQIDTAMRLAWPSANTICALFQSRDVSTAVAINATTGVHQTLVEVHGGEWMRLRKYPASDPIAVWAGQDKKCFRLSTVGQSEEITADFDTDRARPSSQGYSYFDARGALWVGGMPDGAPLKLADDAGAACWMADGETLLFARNHSLWMVRPGASEPQPVPGSFLDKAAPEALPPRGMICAGDGGALAYWGRVGDAHQVRVAQLGVEEIIVRAHLDKGVTAALGQRLWIAMKLYRDDEGRVKEPVWETLKAECSVRRVLPEAERTIIEAVSVGAMPGVLGRLTGQAHPELVPAAALTPVSLEPIPGLKAWLQGTRHAGDVVEVEVVRRALGL